MSFNWPGRCAKVLALLLVGTLLAVVVLSCSSCGAPSFSTEVQQKMEKVVDEVMSEENIPGVIVGVWIPGEGTWTKAKGKADIETGREMLRGDKVRIASNTKPFVATVILQLADEGKLSLDDKLEEFVPGVPYGNEITIRQICNMTSGIYSFTEDEQFDKEFTENPLIEITPQQEVDIALEHEPYFPPGQGWHYSDTNYEILGMIIEQVTGKKAGDELQKRIIEPLELENTSFPNTPDMPGEHSQGYAYKDGEGLVGYTRVNPDVPWTGGAMISDLYDMKTWAKALADGDLVSEKMHKEQLDWVDTGTGAMKYGLGVANLAGFIGHHGAIFGFNSVFFYLPEDDATMVVFTNKSTNSSNEAADIFLGLVKIVFPEKVPK